MTLNNSFFVRSDEKWIINVSDKCKKKKVCTDCKSHIWREFTKKHFIYISLWTLSFKMSKFESSLLLISTLHINESVTGSTMCVVYVLYRIFLTWRSGFEYVLCIPCLTQKATKFDLGFFSDENEITEASCHIMRDTFLFCRILHQ